MGEKGRMSREFEQSNADGRKKESLVFLFLVYKLSGNKSEVQSRWEFKTLKIVCAAAGGSELFLSV